MISLHPTGGAVTMSILVRNWWAFVARGVFAVLFGLVALFVPGAAMLSLVLVFAAYVMADGVVAIISAVSAAKGGERWSLLAVQGVASIVAGGIAAAFPSITVVVFVALIVAWVLISGCLMLAAGFELDADHGRWWLVLGGIVSIAYGTLLVMAPTIGAVVLTWWIGAYALVLGISMLVLAFRLRSKFKSGPLGDLA